ncbi:hypothetical protein LCGC14_2580270 [marine sediment metagenome]|uniref:Nuclease associated modular domain-containing protein n=1 Tax=marine sediment metagenome TaxID=412755 RepID=A0A0F9AF06_9ZZZZ
MKFKYVCVFTFLIITFYTQSIYANDANYRNLIDRVGSPYYLQDFEHGGHQRFSPLFDLGAWHGHMLPTEENIGAFTGPAIITEEYLNFIAPYFEKLTVYKGGEISNANKGKKFTDDHKQKLREAKLKNPVKYWKGKSLPKVMKQKISVSLKQTLKENHNE